LGRDTILQFGGKMLETGDQVEGGDARVAQGGFE
jgi:hypothetical protein